MENKFHIVDFEANCPKCKYYKRLEIKDPCNDCLNFGGNVSTDVPVYFEPKKKGGKKRAKG